MKQGHNQLKTLILSKLDIRKVITFGDYVEAVEDGFARFTRRSVMVAPIVHVAGLDGTFHVKSAGYQDNPRYVAVKVNGNFPDNQSRHGLPTIQGAVILCDGENGALLSVLDSIEITAKRTGAATSVAAKYLADPGSHTATIVGCGVQGFIQLDALMHTLPISTVYVYDDIEERAELFAVEAAQTKGVKVVAVRDLPAATKESSVIVTCTSSRQWFLSKEDVKPGTFIAAVGADNDDKQELEPSLLASSAVVTDVTAQCATIGELHHALDSHAMIESQVYAELGDIVTGAVAPPKLKDNIVVFDSTGSAFQDVAAAGVIYERARDQKLGLAVELG